MTPPRLVDPGDTGHPAVAPAETDEVAGAPGAATGRPAPDLVAAVWRRLTEVRERIAALGVDPSRVRVVAVTKGHGPEMLAAAAACGLTDVGENYAQELLAKHPGAPDGLRWHFLGAVQRNKVPALAPVVEVWEAVDRPAVADAVARHRPGAAVLVQVNVLGDPAKHGCAPDGVATLVAHCRSAGLDTRGLMTVGPAGDPAGSGRIFAQVASAARQLDLPELSMGMSDDYDSAVRAGATSVRLGRALFGPRPGAA